MSTIRSISPAEATGSNKQLFDGLEKKLGMVPNLAQKLANAPAALKAYLGFGAALSDGVLGGKLREQIAVAVANENGCEYCLSAHFVLGGLQGLTHEQLTQAQVAEAENAHDATLLKLAVEIVEKRGRLGAGRVQQLLAEGITEAEIVEVIATVAVNIYTNYTNLVAETEIDFPVVHATTAVGA